MLGLFKKNSVSESSSKSIYEPENLSEGDFPYTDWRRPANPNATAVFHKKKYVIMESRLSTFLDYFNIFLSIIVVCCFAKLIFLTHFEKTILTDGSQLSCVIEDDGKVVAFKPPQAEVKILPRQVNQFNQPNGQ